MVWYGRIARFYASTTDGLVADLNSFRRPTTTSAIAQELPFCRALLPRRSALALRQLTLHHVSTAKNKIPCLPKDSVVKTVAPSSTATFPPFTSYPLPSMCLFPRAVLKTLKTRAYRKSPCCRRRRGTGNGSRGACLEQTMGHGEAPEVPLLRQRHLHVGATFEGRGGKFWHTTCFFFFPTGVRLRSTV